MKKFTALCLALLLLAAAWLQGCGKEGSDPSQSAVSSAGAASSPEEPPAEDASSALPSEDGPSDLPSEPDPAPTKPTKDTYGAPVDDGVLYYQLVNSEYYAVVGVCDSTAESATEIEIPATLGGKPVKKIIEGPRNHLGSWIPLCEKLEKLTIPASIESIEEYTIACRYLREIEVAEGNPSYKSLNGVLFTADGEQLILYPTSKEDAAYEIPDGVKTVSDEAFDDRNTSLKSITIPKSVTKLNFAQLASFASVNVEEGSPLCKEIDGVFYSPDGKKLLLYPSGRSGEHYEIPEGVEVLAPGSLAGPTGGGWELKTVLLPASLTNLGFDDYWEQNLRNLEGIEVAEGNRSYQSIGGVLYTANGKTLICYPTRKPDESYRIPDGVVMTVSGVNFYAESLKTLILPASFVTFSALPVELERIEVEEGNSKYSSKDGLLLSADGKRLIRYPENKPESDVTLPDGIQSIATNAIRFPVHLKTLRLPEGFRAIERNGIDFSFGNVPEAIYFPTSMTRIDNAGIELFRGSGMKIYCANEEQPRGWDQYWLVQIKLTQPDEKGNRVEIEYEKDDVQVFWGYTGE